MAGAMTDRSAGHIIGCYLDTLHPISPHLINKRRRHCEQRLGDIERGLAVTTDKPERQHLFRQRRTLKSELSTARKLESPLWLAETEKAFVGIAAAYSARHDIGIHLWRSTGVPAQVLERARIGEDTEPEAHPPEVRACSIVGCGRRHKAGGFCDSHYRRILRANTNPDSPIAPVAAMRATTTCTITKCGRRHKAQGLCKQHWKLLTRNGRPVTQNLAIQATPSFCSITTCWRPRHHNGWLCQTHATKHRIH